MHEAAEDSPAVGSSSSSAGARVVTVEFPAGISFGGRLVIVTESVQLVSD